MKRISGLRVGLVIVVILGFMPSAGLGAWMPGFGRPIVCKDYIVFGALYGTNLICIDSSGKKIWDKDILQIREGKSWSAFPYAKKDDNSIVVQADRRVIAIDIPSGKETPLFKTHSKDRIVRFDRDSGLVWSFDYWTYRRFRMLNPESGAVLWKNRHIRHVIHASEDTLICLTGKGSFHSSIRLRAVEAFDSKSGKRLWKTRLPKDLNNTDLHEVFVQQHIVISSRDKLICLRAKDGEIVSTLEKSKDYRSGNFGNVCSKDGRLVYVRDSVRSKESPTFYRTVFHFCSVPDLTDESVTELSGPNETVFEFTSYHRYIIAEVPYGRTLDGRTLAGSSRTACFDMKTGQEIWNMRCHEKSEPINGKIYFSDFADIQPLTARIGVIDIATGKEIILYEEKMFKGKPKANTLEIIETTEGKIRVASARELQDLKKDIIGLTTEELDSRLRQNCVAVISRSADKPGIATKRVNADVKNYLKGDRTICHRRIYQVEGGWQGKLFIEIEGGMVVSVKLLPRISEDEPSSSPQD